MTFYTEGEEDEKEVRRKRRRRKRRRKRIFYFKRTKRLFSFFDIVSGFSSRWL
jgi:hypothetical protein